ncbi:hypothetical protein [Olivibacter domesticus]|uniref:Uncharacterized protein n=2 Tax=Olivibacter domesticus TaxID=407022 RepID=A0A1H7J3Q8_OLID1|nr:hypothetical protein [Olivibacter domesticus]SEK67765.1 hypothetical protein SAMN05661044_00875 [Olivibacter domesticus]
MIDQIKTITDYKPAKAFLKRKLFWYLVPNLLFNGIIPYFSFENPTAVSLFEGEFCFARFILPMALFVPLAITVDFMKKITEFFTTANLGKLWDDEQVNMRFFLREGVYNGLKTFLAILIIMLVVQWLLPAESTFNGLLLACINGILACSLAAYFTLVSVKQINTILEEYVNAVERN